MQTTAPDLSRIDAAFLAAIPIAFARKHAILLTADNVLAHAADTPEDVLDVVRRHLNRIVNEVVLDRSTIIAAISRAYAQRTGEAAEVIDRLDASTTLSELHALANRDDLLDNAARAPVIKLVNLVLFEAAKADASDVHVQPYEDRLLIRTRIDGVLYDTFTLPKSVQDEVVSRLKVMGRMNIAEKRLAQDGRATVRVGEKTIDLRIASLPTGFGERVVVRLLDKSARLFDLAELGMDAGSLARFAKLIAREHGLILVTGPTGSGKSTTLYSALTRLNGKEKNILTLEDPIEYQLDGVSQTQVSDKKGMTFASGLRSVLRQDPDIIMVGEIRDGETATMAIQSSLTGHLVFSTLHTNDAASSITRLLDLGIEPYLVASSLVGVLAQRLVRKVCDACATPANFSAADLAWLGIGVGGGTAARAATEIGGQAHELALVAEEQSAPSNAVTGVGDEMCELATPHATSAARVGTGCDRCRGTGYRGRIGLFELLAIDDSLRDLISRRATATEIRAAATIRSLRDDGVAKILLGQTTIAASRARDIR